MSSSYDWNDLVEAGRTRTSQITPPRTTPAWLKFLGVALVICFGWSPWHLIWWFFVGWIVAIIAFKIAMRLGYNPFG